MKTTGVRIDLDPAESERWFSQVPEDRAIARRLIQQEVGFLAMDVATREQRPVHVFLYADAELYLADWTAEPSDLCTGVVLRAMLDAYTAALDAATVTRVTGSLLEREQYKRREFRLLSHTNALRYTWAQSVDDPTAYLFCSELTPDVVEDFLLRLKGERPLHAPPPP